MSRLAIEVDFNRCTGCRSCEFICALAHAGVIRPTASAIRIVSSVDGGTNIPLVCISCKDRPCLEVCPVGAIRLDKRLDLPVIDMETCIGCQACVSACPYQGIFFDPVAKKAVKCDLCGGNPLCVQACTGVYDMPAALRVVDLDKEVAVDREERAKERLRVLQELRNRGDACEG